MKNYKKIITGLCLFIAAMAFWLLVPNKTVSAATLFDAQRCEKTLKFIDIAHIQCQTSSDTVTFVDKNPTDQWDPIANTANSDDRYNIQYTPAGNLFCDPGNVDSRRGTNSVNYRFGISLTDAAVEDGLKVSDAGKSLRYKLNLGYTPPGTTGCVRYGGGGGKNGSVTETGRIKYIVRFLDNSIRPLSGVSSGALSNASYTLVPGYNNAPVDERGRTNSSVLAFVDGNFQSCSGNLIIATTANRATDSVSATSWTLKKDNNGINQQNFPNIYALFKAANVSGCSVTVGPFNRGIAAPSQSFSVAGIPPSTDNNGVTSGSLGVGETRSCEANFDFGFEWLICPILHLADDAAGAFNNFIESQLNFCTGESSTTGETCEDNNLTPQVKTAWTFFRTIATALLVIIMLVMVISQAIGGTFFDAYTIRKVLPKIIVAVVLIQISWYLFKFLIDISNDLGHGIQSLMLAPFGGQSNTDLAKLIGHGVRVATGGRGEADAFAVFFAIAGAAAFYVSLPGLALLALYVVAALLTAFIVLILRKILIIALVILAPIALILWILPGTERYWKNWSDNFTKVLAMFPLIMALIAAGRIAAYIVAGSPGGTTSLMPQVAVAHLGPLSVPYFASVTDFATLAIIIVAFFLPYFLLPKTFSWGGGLMRLIGEGVKAGMNRATKKPAEYLEGVEKGWREQRRRDSMERVARGEGFNPRAPWRLPIDKIRSGAWNPLLGAGPTKIPGTGRVYEGSRRRSRSMRAYVEQGEKSLQEDIGASEAALVRERQEHKARGGDHDVLLQAIANGQERYYDPGLKKWKNLGIRSGADRMAARKQLAKLGAGMNYRYLENYFEHTKNNGTDEQKAEMRKFFDDNVDLLIGKLPHIYKSINQAADADPDSIAGMHGVEVEAILSDLNSKIKGGDEGAKVTLNKFLHNFQRAVENAQFGGAQLENGALRAVKGFLTKDTTTADDLLNGEDGINTAQYHGRAGEGREAIMPGEPPRNIRLLERGGENVDNTLRDVLDDIILKEGYVKPRLGPEATPQGEIRIEHQERPPSGGTRPPQGSGTWSPTPGSASTPVKPPSPPEEPPSYGGGSPGPEPPSPTRSYAPIPPEEFGPEGRFPPPAV